MHPVAAISRRGLSVLWPQIAQSSALFISGAHLHTEDDSTASAYHAENNSTVADSTTGAASTASLLGVALHISNAGPSSLQPHLPPDGGFLFKSNSNLNSSCGTGLHIMRQPGILASSSRSPLGLIRTSRGPSLHADLMQAGVQARTMSFDSIKDIIKDPRHKTSNILMGVNIVASVTVWLNPGLMGKLAQVNYMLNAGEWYRIITASFLHGSILHLLLNMLGLHWVGKPLEEQCGRNTYLAIYFSSVLSAGLAYFWFGSMNMMAVGSSGAVFGLISALVSYRVINRAFVGFGQDQINWILQLVAINLGLSLMMGAPLLNVAHVGGLVGGCASMVLFGPRYVWQSGSVVNKPILPWFR